MSTLHYRLTDRALHVLDGGDEVLELRADGDCIVRSVAPDGTRHTYVQNHPQLLSVLADDFHSGSVFGIGIEELPAAISEHFAIPSIIVLIPSANSSVRLLLARERLEISQLNLLRRHLAPFLGVLNESKLFKAEPRADRRRTE